MQWSVRQTGPGRTKHGDDSDASPGAAKRKADERICRVIPLPQAEKFLPAAFVKKIVVLLHVQRALPLWLDGHGSENHEGMVAIAAVADRAAIQSTPQLARYHAAGSVLGIFGDSADLDLGIPLDESAQRIPVTLPIIG